MPTQDLMQDEPPTQTDNYGTESTWSYDNALSSGKCPKCGGALVWSRAREVWECVEHGQPREE